MREPEATQGNAKTARDYYRRKALADAERLTKETGRKHVVRDDYDRFYVCPLYELGAEGYRADAGYSALGVLVAESMK
jgi:hypothetical protein